MFAINKICIDSRFRVAGTPTEFRVELPESILIPERTVCMITDISIPHSWYSIDDANDRIYFRRSVAAAKMDVVLMLNHQNYDINTLAAELQLALNVLFPGEFVLSASTVLGTVKIATGVGGTTFQLLTNEELSTRVDGTWSGTSFDPANPMSCNMMLRNTTPAINSSTRP